MDGSEDPQPPLSVTVTVGASIGETGPFEDIDALERRMAIGLDRQMALHKQKRVAATIAAVSLAAIAGTGCIGPAASAPPTGCAAALAYLAAHAAPGFVSYCPHYAGGKAAQTVVPPQQVNDPNVVHGFIYINDTNCAIAYENEAANSHGHFVPDANGDGNYQWVWPVPFDPYGSCP